jgi:ribosomal protein S18 acetylase RimI-like enzyme
MGDDGRMPSDLRIRTAVAADDEALRRIDATAWDSSSTFPSVLATTDDKPFFDEGHQPEDHLVADLDGKVAGYVRLRPGTPLPESSHVVQVNGIAVDAAARRKGVAAALLAAAEQRARDQGASKITLRVFGTNAAARRVYERAGYVVEGILRGEFRIDGVDIDDYNLARYLTAGGDQR